MYHIICVPLPSTGFWHLMRPRVVLSSKASPRIKAAYAQKIVEASRAPENFRRSQFIHSYPWISMNSLGWSWMQHPIDFCCRFCILVTPLWDLPCLAKLRSPESHGNPGALREVRDWNGWLWYLHVPPPFETWMNQGHAVSVARYG
jgi:hypothetical protein